MDFLSLFDPSDGVQNKAKARHKEQENVNMKPEGTVKGRRRGRRANGKNETLPEESSFLNEPDLSTEIMVKDGSYIDSYIEINKECDESKTEDKKVKKRNISRKSRRRKKISPFKDFEKIYTTNNNFNTSAVKSKVEIGKNVNDLTNFKSHYRIDDNYQHGNSQHGNDQHGNNQQGNSQHGNNQHGNSQHGNSRHGNSQHGNSRHGNSQHGNDQHGNTRHGNDQHVHDENGNDNDVDFKDNAVYNVIDKLEKVSLKDDMFLAGDFTAQDLESDFFYCSDDDDEFVDDSTSDGEDSSNEVGRSLPPEPRFGNVEYKLRLSTQCERRFQHLVTQLKWRLVSGGGSCVYVIGVRDCGALVGLRARALRSSLRALRRMAGALHAHISHLTARRVTAHRAVAEVYIKKLAHSQQSVELRVAVMGANEAGKSTLIGVLTQGELDNGNGSARLNMFRHQHEVKTGMTSSLSHEILGFDAQGNVVNYGCSELMTAERIGERSAKLVSFLDLAGHSKYQRTTRHGITGYSPHAAMLVISATAGISPITEEHMGILLALRLPFFVVINKCELARDAVPPLLDRLHSLLHHAQKKPLLITDEGLARNCCGPQKLILDSIDEERAAPQDGDHQVFEQVAVFPVSCVRGFGLNALHAHLLALQPPSQDVQAPPEEETCEFQIDEIFHVGDSGGPVVGGLLTRGRLFERDRLLIGPLDDGSFKMVGVRSIYRNRVPCGAARAGQPASLGLHQPCPPVRPGMVLLAVPEGYGRAKRRVWGACETACKRKQISELIRSKQSPIEARTQRIRKKNKNLLQDIALVEEVLTKEIPRNECNIYHSDSDTSGRSDANSDKSDAKSYKSDADSDKTNVKSYKSDADSDKSDVKSYKSDADSDKSDVKSYKSDADSDKSGVKSYKSDADSDKSDVKSYNCDAESEKSEETSEIVGKDDNECICDDKVLLEDPNDPWGCIYFQANVHVIRHSTAIHPGFQCTVHVGNVRQTAIIEGIMSRNNVLCAGESASALFRFVRTCEYLAKGRQLLFTQGLGTRGVGRITQIFPYVP